MVLALSGVYRSRNLVTDLSHQSTLILRATLYIVAVFLTVSFYAKMFSYSRAIFMLFFILIPVGLISVRQIFFLIRRRFGNDHRWINRILFFGESHLTVELEKNLKSNPYFTFEIRKVSPAKIRAFAMRFDKQVFLDEFKKFMAECLAKGKTR
jgi:FlaA1/EpsC-like NDP-sugar epimerase